MEASILSNVVLQKIGAVICNHDPNSSDFPGIYEIQLLLDSCDDSTMREISSLLAQTEAPELLTQVLANVFNINNETRATATSEYQDSSMDLSPVTFHNLPESFISTVDCCLSIFRRMDASNDFLVAVSKTDLPKYAIKTLNTFIEDKRLVASNFRPLLTSLILLDKIYKTEGVCRPSGDDGMVMALMNVFMNFEFHVEELVLLVKSYSLMVTGQIVNEDNYVFVLAEDSSIDFLLDILRKCFLTEQKYPNYKGIYALDLAKALENFAAIEGFKEKLLDSGAIELLVTLMQQGHDSDAVNAAHAINRLLHDPWVKSDRKDSENIESPILLNGVQGSRSANSGLGCWRNSSTLVQAFQSLQMNTADQDHLRDSHSKTRTECNTMSPDVSGEDQITATSVINSGQTGATIFDEEVEQACVKEECQQVTGTDANRKNAGEQLKVTGCPEDKQIQNGNQVEAVAISEHSHPCEGRNENAVIVMTDELKNIFDSFAPERDWRGKEVLPTWEPNISEEAEYGEDKRVINNAETNTHGSKRKIRVISRDFHPQAQKSDHLSGSELSCVHDQIVAEGFNNLYDEKTSEMLNELLSEEKLHENKLFDFFNTWPMQLSFNLRRCGSIERNLRVVPARNLPEKVIPVTHLQPELDYHLVLKRFTFWKIPQLVNPKYPGFTFVGPWQKIPSELEDLKFFFTKTEKTLDGTPHAKKVESESGVKSSDEEDNFVFVLSAKKVKDFLFNFTWRKFFPMLLVYHQLLAQGESTDKESLIKHGITILKPPEENGPAVTLIQTYGKLSVDYVPALRFMQWPSCASEWAIRERQSWPTHGTVDEVVKTGCHLVPKQPPSLPEAHKDYGLYWQFSFAAAENTLLNLLNKDIPVLANCLRLLKFVRELHLDRPELLKSYHLQTVTLWAAERCPITHWKKDNFLGHFLDLLDDLVHYLINFNLPNYFVSNQNLFGNFSKDFLIDVAQRVSKIRKNPGKYLHSSHDPEKFGVYVM
eukprot:gene12246-13507_t